MKIKEEILACLISGFLAIWIYSFFSWMNIIDDKQDIFLEDRPMYQREIWLMQGKLDLIINQCLWNSQKQ